MVAPTRTPFCMPNHGDQTAWLRGGGARCVNPGTAPQRPWHIVLLGPPGGGKGTQADLIVARFGACHLSTGDLFRSIRSGCGGAASPAAQQAVAAMERGELVDDATLIAMIRERAACLICRQGFLLDGFPRTHEQARAFDDILAAIGVRLDAVVNLVVPEAVLVERLAGRRICSGCQASFHVVEQPPRRAGVCDHCGGELITRVDDQPEAVRHRLEVWHATARPVVDHYRRLGVLVDVDGARPPAAVFATIEQVLRPLAARTAG